MASYVVMQAPGGAAVRDADDAVFVRDGFAYLAFFLPVVWLLWHRLWIEAALALAVTVGLTAAWQCCGFRSRRRRCSRCWSRSISGLEGAALRIAALRRRGWRECGVVDADSLDDAETRYLHRDRRRGGRSVRQSPTRCRRRARRARPIPVQRSACSAQSGQRPDMRVAIIDYGSGNLRSATKAFERAAREAGIDAPRSS